MPTERVWRELIKAMERQERQQKGFWPTVGRLWITAAPRRLSRPYHRWFRVYFTRHQGTPRWFYNPLAWLYNYWH
ncbi:MAG: hypothetical protein JWP44_4508 [Mucilaginibacter sp.]|nr:hypothetical protein [Mucilaginibacter sp.]